MLLVEMCSTLIAKRPLLLLGRSLFSPAHIAPLSHTRLCTVPADSSREKHLDWTRAVSSRFELRPSVLSPLHSLHRQNEDVELKQQLVKDQLLAHHLLNSEQLQLEEGQDVMTALTERSEKFAKLMEQYDELVHTRALPLCKHPALMYDYYSMLARQAQQKDEDAHGSFLVNSGQTDVWQFWEQEFAKKYERIPSLEPLEVIYNKQNQEVELEKLRAQAKSAVAKSLRVRKISSKPADGWYCSTGKRKTSVAQVMLRPGQGRILVNRKPYDQYFGDITCRAHLLKPMLVTNTAGQYDVMVLVRGGGLSSQAQAVAHGMSTAMVRCSPQLAAELGPAKLLSPDTRRVERKKPGLKKARKAFAWVKR